MAKMKAASYLFHIAVLLSLTAGLPFFAVPGANNQQGSGGKNTGSKNVINPILPAKTQQPVSQVSTTKKPKTTEMRQNYTTEVLRPTVAAAGLPEWIRSNPEKVYMSHPCNVVHNFQTQDFEATDKKAGNKRIKCHRLSEGELMSRRKCSETFKESFTAMSFEQAIKNAQERTRPKKKKRKGRKERKERKRKQKSKKIRAKRDASRTKMKPGTWEVCNCRARYSVDPDTGLGMTCGTCSTIYRQHTTSRFPPYVNGIICHPNEDELVYDSEGNPSGRCVQQSFTQDLLEWKGKWIKDVVQSQRLGIDVYVEDWDNYRQVIKSSCVFQFFVV